MLRVAIFYLLLMLPYIVAVREDNVVLAGNGDIWNTLWTWQHIAENWNNPFYSQALLAPQGSSIVPSDMVGGYLYALFANMTSSVGFYNFYSIFCFWLFCFGTHLWSQSSGFEGYLAGSIAYSASAFRCIIHNGSSEMLTLSLLPLMIFFWKRSNKRGYKEVILTCLMLLLLFGSWYGAIMTLGMILAVEKKWSRRKLFFIGIGILVVVVWSYFSQQILMHSHIIDIKKSSMELDAIRRSYGVADIQSYFRVYPFQSPDFSLISLSNEDFYHSTYIGWTAILLCLCNIFHTDIWKEYRMIFVGVIFFFLSLGPVLVVDMHPLVILEQYVIPMPYLLLEKFWGFSQLTLLYRFSLIPMLFIAYFASQVNFEKNQNFMALFLAGCILIEGGFVSPTKSIPNTRDLPYLDLTRFGFHNLKKGNMVLFPRGNIETSLYEQKEHKMPLMSTLNRKESQIARQFWMEIEREGWSDCEDFLQRSKSFDINYILIDKRQPIFPSKISNVVQNALRPCPKYTVQTSTTHHLISFP